MLVQLYLCKNVRIQFHSDNYLTIIHMYRQYLLAEGKFGQAIKTVEIHIKLFMHLIRIFSDCLVVLFPSRLTCLKATESLPEFFCCPYLHHPTRFI